MKYLYLVFISLGIFFLPAQTILNGYAKVTSVTGSNVLALSNVNVTNHNFVVGEQVIVMQMQDNVIGTNTTNVATFGNLSAISNAGKYEIRTISARTPTSGSPTSVTLTAALANTYNTGSNSSVQLITFHNMGTNYVTTANITGLDWDGNVGGVVAFYVTNTLTLNHRVLADGLGFLGGAMSSSEDITCANTVYITNSNLKAFKGEGIYKNTDANLTNGRGHMLNGGGGGSQNNTGGGGGGNYSAGGDGGLGWGCTAANSGYGLGGLSLSAQVSASRIFMGGGGGGGQQNNGVGTAGGDGGGIILIKASTFSTNTTCGASILISANGITAANSGNDGAGGGGAGGSIVIQASTYSINSTCPLTISANAGNGGSVGNSGSHGGGGGGGQGAVIYSTVAPTTNVTTQTSIGTGGANDNTGTGTSASPGAGTSGSGVIGPSAGPLPIELVDFKARTQDGRILLLWSTASEKNNDYFTVERSTNGNEYTAVSKIKGAGTTQSYKNYSTYDNEPVDGISYYRLKQTDYDGSYNYSPVISVDFSEKLDFTFFPNPVKSGEIISFVISKNEGIKEIQVSVSDVTGKKIYVETMHAGSESKAELSLTDLNLNPGIYILKVQSGSLSQVKKLVVQ